MHNGLQRCAVCRYTQGNYNLATMCRCKLCHKAQRKCTLNSKQRAEVFQNKIKCQSSPKNNNKRATKSRSSEHTVPEHVQKRPAASPLQVMSLPEVGRALRHPTGQVGTIAGVETNIAGRKVRAPYRPTSPTEGEVRTVRRARSEGSGFRFQGRITEVNISSSGPLPVGGAVHR